MEQRATFELREGGSHDVGSVSPTFYQQLLRQLIYVAFKELIAVVLNRGAAAPMGVLKSSRGAADFLMSIY